MLVLFTSPPSRFFSSYLVFLRPLVRFIYFVSFGRVVHLASFRCFRSYLGSFVRSLVSVISVRLIVSFTPSPSRFFRSYIGSFVRSLVSFPFACSFRSHRPFSLYFASLDSSRFFVDSSGSWGAPISPHGLLMHFKHPVCKSSLWILGSSCCTVRKLQGPRF